MEMEKVARRFRAQCSTELAGAKRRTRYSEWLQLLGREHIALADRAGKTHQEIATSLGIDVRTVHIWRQRHPAPALARQTPRVVPITVVDDSVPVAGRLAGSVVIHGPCGVRVEGLDTAGLADLLRALA